jgi:hypothetical protein
LKAKPAASVSACSAIRRSPGASSFTKFTTTKTHSLRISPPATTKGFAAAIDDQTDQRAISGLAFSNEMAAAEGIAE